MSFCAWGDWWTTVAPAWKLVCWHSFLCLHESFLSVFCFVFAPFGSRQLCKKKKRKKLDRMQLYQWVVHMKLWIDFRLRGIFKLRLWLNKSRANLNNIPLCSIHRSGEWCGLLNCQSSTSYFTVMTKAVVQRDDSAPKHMQYSCFWHSVYPYHLNLFFLSRTNTPPHTHSPLLMYSIMLALPTEVQDG